MIYYNCSILGTVFYSHFIKCLSSLKPLVCIFSLVLKEDFVKRKKYKGLKEGLGNCNSVGALCAFRNFPSQLPTRAWFFALSLPHCSFPNTTLLPRCSLYHRMLNQSFQTHKATLYKLRNTVSKYPFLLDTDSHLGQVISHYYQIPFS